MNGKATRRELEARLMSLEATLTAVIGAVRGHDTALEALVADYKARRGGGA